MKKLIIFLVLISFTKSYSQLLPPENKPDMELTEDEATLRIQSWQAKVKELEDKLKSAKDERESLTQQLAAAKASLQACKDAINSMLGAAQADFEAFRERLGKLEAKVREKESLSNDVLADQRDQIVALEKELNELRGMKLSLWPEFFNKIVDLGKRIKNLYREKKITTYTVGTWAENKDCLWNIAGRIEIYGDPNMWPKIWQANTDQIRNPDIIQPGQVLQIPLKGPKNPEELKAERGYYRQKREAANTPVTGAEATTAPTEGQN